MRRFTPEHHPMSKDVGARGEKWWTNHTVE